MPNVRIHALLPAVLAMLTACGGGGSSDPVATTTAAANPVTAAVATSTVPAAQMPMPPVTPVTPLTAATPVLSARAELGRQIFNDPNLSEPRGTACVACHQANTGFANNNGSTIGVALGSRPGALGLRNAMTNAYQGFIPAFGFITEDDKTEAIGGHFWDGRADTLALQALGPFLNPLEMNNPSKAAVLTKIANAPYAAAFRREFGNDIFSNTERAFEQIGVAIEAFERDALQPFSSKYDAMVRGQTTLTAAEARGMALFMDPVRANCSGCHLMDPTSGNPQDSPFSEFTYYAVGVPRNSAIPRNANPAFYDLGLCGPDRTAPALPTTVTAGTTIEQFCGQFRMPTLRNVAQRQAFMHNGFFKDLREVVRFYSTRISDPQRWYGPSGIPNDLPPQYVGNIEKTKPPFNRSPSEPAVLTEAEVNDVVAFLRTLSDGFRP